MRMTVSSSEFSRFNRAQELLRSPVVCDVRVRSGVCCIWLTPIGEKLRHKTRGRFTCFRLTKGNEKEDIADRASLDAGLRRSRRCGWGGVALESTQHAAQSDLELPGRRVPWRKGCAIFIDDEDRRYCPAPPFANAISRFTQTCQSAATFIC